MCIPIKKTIHQCTEDLKKSGILSYLIRLCLSGAEELQCIDLLKEWGFAIYEELPDSVMSVSPIKIPSKKI